MAGGTSVPRGLRRLFAAIAVGSLGVIAWEAALCPAATAVPLERTSMATLPSLPAPTPAPVAAAPAAPTLTLHGLARSSELTVTPFGADGEPSAVAFAALDRFFAPKPLTLQRYLAHRAPPPPKAEPSPIDPRLVALLMDLSGAFDGRPITVVSGHREPGRGTRESSYHVKGMAADISIEGVKPHELYFKALELGARGTGLYRHFVHVDVRDAPRYRWGGGGLARR